MNEKTKIKLDWIISDLEDHGLEKEIIYVDLRAAIMRQCGINHNTISTYQNALVAFGYLEEKVPRKVWVINHGEKHI